MRLTISNHIILTMRSYFILNNFICDFILYFIIAAVITTVAAGAGVPLSVFEPVKNLSKFFIIMAMAAIGLNSNMIKLIKTGGKPIILGAVCWMGITGVSLLMQHVMGLW